MKEIQSDGVLLARLITGDSWEKGLSFYSQDDDYIQLGTWNYDAGKSLNAHIHNHVPRTTDHTQEFIFVRKGRLLTRIFDKEQKPVTEIEMAAGDMLVLLSGGHGYDILEDDTQVIEVKNGPYPGAEADRTRF